MKSSENLPIRLVNRNFNHPRSLCFQNTFFLINEISSAKLVYHIYDRIIPGSQYDSTDLYQ